MLKLGIDTGGTYTDAVLLDAQGNIAAAAKALTTHQALDEGINAAIGKLPAALLSQVGLVGLSTTLATNAIVEGRVSKAALILIGFGPETLKRSSLGEVLGQDPVYFVDGGHGPAGQETKPFAHQNLIDELDKCATDISGFAVVSAFAVRNPAHENQARTIIQEHTGKPVTCSHELTSKLDGPRRALTTLFNARLISRITALFDAVATALHAYAITAPVMVVRGDGALFSVESARQRPIETILSGPAASCVGSCFLTGLDHALISDVGGTTTDIGMVEHGRPKRSLSGAFVGQHRTMVEAVDVVTIGLGGDSLIAADDGKLLIGPERALPIGRLAQSHPAIVNELKSQVERPEPRPFDGMFAVLHALPADLPSLSRTQSQLIELLRQGPQSLEIIMERERLGMSFQTLVKRGWILMSAMTPSDAAHLTGELALFDHQAPELAAALLHRSLHRTRLATLDGIDGFGGHLMALFQQRTAAELLRFGLIQDGLNERSLNDPNNQDLLDIVTSPAQSSSILQINAQFQTPIIGVGAPAGLFYPNVAARLNADLRLPERFDVCNAVGAVVGLVRASSEVRIDVDDDLITVLLPSGPQTMASFETAINLARTSAEQQASAALSQEGATDVTVTTSQTINDYNDVTGSKKIVSATVSAEALGRPPFAKAV